MSEQEQLKPTVTTQMVPLLRKWALSLLRHLLEDEPLRKIPLSSEEMDFLASATPLPDKPRRSLLMRMGVQTAMLPRRRKARLRLLRQPKRWQQRVRNRAALQLQDRRDRFVTYFWQPLAQAAWGDPQFVAQLNLAMSRYWRQRSLFPKGVMPLVHVEPNTFWLLLLMHAKLDDSCSSQLLHRLQIVVQKESLIPGWARFWDQWLLWRMTQAQPQSLKQLPPLMRQALENLPFYKLANPSETKQPGRLRLLLRRIKRVLLLVLPGFASAPVHVLAHRGWERDMPPFLYQFHLPRKRRKE